MAAAGDWSLCGQVCFLCMFGRSRFSPSQGQLLCHQQSWLMTETWRLKFWIELRSGLASFPFYFENLAFYLLLLACSHAEGCWRQIRHCHDQTDQTVLRARTPRGYDDWKFALKREGGGAFMIWDNMNDQGTATLIVTIGCPPHQLTWGLTEANWKTMIYTNCNICSS